jgi:zinc protease
MGATLAAVGDISMEEVAKLVESYLGDWRGASSQPDAGQAALSPAPPGTTLYLVDKPGAAQSVIRVGAVGVPRRHPDYFALALLNHLFGGQFTSRLNANLRQDKGYSYGYRSGFDWYHRSSLFLAGGSVQTAVTREAVVETLREFREVAGERPVTEAEFQTAKDGLLRLFPSSFETPSQILDQLAQIAFFGLPDDYYRSWPAAIEAVSLADVRRVARTWVDPDRLVLLVVGDRRVVEPGLRELGMPMRNIDHEGQDV